MRVVFSAIGMLALVTGIPTAAKACDAWVEDCSRFVSSAAHIASGAARNAYAHRGRVLGGRPAGCPPVWCACWAAMKHLGLSPAQSKKKGLWLARSWTRVGRPAAGPAPGVIAVYARGRRGGHVGIVTKVLGPGQIVLLSGNDGRRVRERVRSTRGVIAWRWAS